MVASSGANGLAIICALVAIVLHPSSANSRGAFGIKGLYEREGRVADPFEAVDEEDIGGRARSSANRHDFGSLKNPGIPQAPFLVRTERAAKPDKETLEAAVNKAAKILAMELNPASNTTWTTPSTHGSKRTKSAATTAAWSKSATSATTVAKGVTRSTVAASGDSDAKTTAKANANETTTESEATSVPQPKSISTISFKSKMDKKKQKLRAFRMDMIKRYRLALKKRKEAMALRAFKERAKNLTGR